MYNNKPVRHIKLLIGSSGTGKSTYVANNSNDFEGYEIISLDEVVSEFRNRFRKDGKEISDDTLFAKKKGEIDNACYDKLREAVKNGKNLIIDRNNSTNYIRETTIDIAKQSPEFNYITTAIVIHPPEEMEHINRLLKRSICSDRRFGTINTVTLQNPEPIRNEMFDHIIEVGTPPVKPLFSDYIKQKNVDIKTIVSDATNFSRYR